MVTEPDPKTSGGECLSSLQREQVVTRGIVTFINNLLTSLSEEFRNPSGTESTSRALFSRLKDQRSGGKDENVLVESK